MDSVDIKEVLGNVKYPGFSRDIVSFGLVREAELQDGNARVLIRFGSENDAVRQEILQGIHQALTDLGFAEPIIEVESAAPAQSAGIQEPEVLSTVKHTIAVASGKGGVGKSTVAANLATALSKQGFKVGILDLDVYGPSLPVTMGVHQVPEVIDGNKLKPVMKYDMELMSLGFMLSDSSPVIWRGAMVSKMVQQFLRDVIWGELDYMILDLPPGTGDVQLTLVQRLALTGAVIVTTPQDLALQDVQRGADMFAKVNTPVLGIVENMSYHVCENCGHKSEIFSSGGGDRESQRLEVPLLGKIPLNEEIMRSAEKGEPLLVSLPDSEAAGIFKDVAKKIDEFVTA